MKRLSLIISLILLSAVQCYADGAMFHLAQRRRAGVDKYYNVTATYTMTIPSGDRAGIGICADGRERLGPELISDPNFTSNIADSVGSPWAYNAATDLYEIDGSQVANKAVRFDDITSLSASDLYQLKSVITASAGSLQAYIGAGGYTHSESETDWYPSSGIINDRLKPYSGITEGNIYIAADVDFVGTESYLSIKQILSPLNGIFCEIDRTTGHLTLTKRVAGVETVLIDEAVTYGDGYELIVVKKNTSSTSCIVDVFYNGLRVGTQQTISDAKLLTGKVHYSTGTATGTDTFIRYRTSGEISTGTLTSGTLYRITATQADHFYAGCAVDEHFISDGTETCDANNKAVEVYQP